MRKIKSLNVIKDVRSCNKKREAKIMAVVWKKSNLKFACKGSDGTQSNRNFSNVSQAADETKVNALADIVAKLTGDKVEAATLTVTQTITK